MMSNSSEILLLAVSRECTILSGEIAWLGGRVSTGQAQAMELQRFDILTQHAQALGVLIACLARGGQGREAALRDIPLPAVRQRLRDALSGRVSTPPPGAHDTVLWL